MYTMELTSSQRKSLLSCSSPKGLSCFKLNVELGCLLYSLLGLVYTSTKPWRLKRICLIHCLLNAQAALFNKEITFRYDTPDVIRIRNNQGESKKADTFWNTNQPQISLR